jgi:hypothetical protein
VVIFIFGAVCVWAVVMASPQANAVAVKFCLGSGCIVRPVLWSGCFVTGRSGSASDSVRQADAIIADTLVTQPWLA